MSEEITRMPAVALRGMTILPSMIVHFDVSRDKSIKAIEQAMTADQKLFVVTQRDPEASDPGIDDLYHIGTVVEIKQLVKLPKNIIRVLVEGLERAELLEMEVTSKLEGAFARTKGLADISSNTGQGWGSITLNIDKNENSIRCQTVAEHCRISGRQSCNVPGCQRSGLSGKRR